MDLIEQLESLRIPDSDFFGASIQQQTRMCAKNDMLDDCLEIIWKWLKEKDLLNE